MPLSTLGPATAAVPTRRRSLLPMEPWTLVGFALATVALVLVGFFTWNAQATRIAAEARVAETQEIREQALVVLTTLIDMETGQRGFLLTGQPKYLEPYARAAARLDGQLQGIQALAAYDPVQARRAGELATLAKAKVDELEDTIRLAREDRPAALAIVAGNRGQGLMDATRQLLNEMRTAEARQLVARQGELVRAERAASVVTFGGLATLAVLGALALGVTIRQYRVREAEAWQRESLAALSIELQGEQTVDALAERMLSVLARRLDAAVGAVHVLDGEGRLHRVAGFALDGSAPERAGPASAATGASGLAGQVARDGRALVVRDVPPGYLDASSGTGRAAPRELLIAPATFEGDVRAVVELGLFRHVGSTDEELLARASAALGGAMRNAVERARLVDLLEETQRQSEELQTQQEELRVSNEELEEQGRALQESQTQLQRQQQQLEETNADLEAHAERLAQQKAQLTAQQGELIGQARELERSNQYKSEFLANMSHELRTPLNSTLILARLLAENKAGNLTPEQVRFAETIGSAGNDLLALINDILDLSKIEAGKVEVVLETVPLARVAEQMNATFRQTAIAKKLAFEVRLDPAAPAAIETDAQRLAQILRNLVANAIKFTEAGGVVLHVRADGPERVAFAVRDSGIGIAAEHQGAIFDAFRQADGSTHRKYGGTGLGLAISRDLARLLGGDVSLESASGAGSTFTLLLPRVAPQAAPERADAGPAPMLAPEPAPPPVPVAPRAPAAVPRPPPPATVDDGPIPDATHGIDDDRHRLEGGRRVILVVEDDVRFARILFDLAREKGFRCVVATTAADGLALARRLVPSAILLDVHLPDGSGLHVLDDLKRDPRTRHVPVHVASVEDVGREARQLGAVGYAVKPVSRDTLVAALESLERRLAPGPRRVLVVEDDRRQMASIEDLLRGDGIEIVGVGDAEAALAALRSAAFDCIVMDLALPDMSGDQLLEAMAADADLAFPPVIVYTGRTLTRDEEQKLRRHSQSIIVKDARSPERLLDEVTLFLHQVESDLPPERQRMLREARHRERGLEGRRILVVEDDVRNVFALSSVLEPKGARITIARNGREALEALARDGVAGVAGAGEQAIDLVLMDVMMPEMDGLTAMRHIRERPEWRRLPIIALTAKAMKDDQEKCLAAGANDYVAKPLDVDKLLSLIRVWLPR